MAKINNERPLSLARLKEVLDYDPKIGTFRWKITGGPRAVAGSIAGCIRKRGYRIIIIDWQQYRASRLAWFYSYGEWPSQFVDHVNLIKSDDRLENLREASVGENACNTRKCNTNSTGVKGVHLTTDGRFGVSIWKNKKSHWIGTFKSLSEATLARKIAAERLHGEFARHV